MNKASTDLKIDFDTLFKEMSHEIVPNCDSKSGCYHRAKYAITMMCPKCEKDKVIWLACIEHYKIYLSRLHTKFYNHCNEDWSLKEMTYKVDGL